MTDEPDDGKATKPTPEATTPAPKASAKTSAKSKSKPVAKAAPKRAVPKKPATESSASRTAVNATPKPEASSAPKPSAKTPEAPSKDRHQGETLVTRAWPGLVAGVVGAIVIIIISGLLGFGSGTGALRADLDTLNQETERLALAGGDVEAIGRLQVRLDGMEEDLRALNAGVARSADLVATETAVQDARERLAVLENGGARSGGGGGGLSAITASVVAIDGRLAALSGRVNALEAVTPSDLQARLNALVAGTDFAALEARVGIIEDDQLAQDMRRAALALALAQLSRSTQGSGPFAAELEAVAALRPTDPYVAQLRPSAQSGVPTQAMLASEFNAVRRRVIAADRAAQYDGFLSGVWHWFSGLITFQRTGQIEGNSVDAVLARANLRLQEDNLPAVVGEMASLPEAVREPANAWLTMAAARVSLDRLIAALSTEVIGELE